MTDYESISYDVFKVLLVKLCDENDLEFKHVVTPAIEDLEIIRFEYINRAVICYLITSQKKNILLRTDQETIDKWCREYDVTLKPNCSVKLKHETTRTQLALQQIRFCN